MPLFGDVKNDRVRLTEMGQAVRTHWLAITQFYPQVTLDEFIVMPNHLHGLLHLGTPVQRARVGSQLCCDRTDEKNPPIIPTSPTGGTIRPGSLPSIIRNFKSYTTKAINHISPDPGNPVWQKNFYDEIVRSEADLPHIRNYIRYNPQNWINDLHYNP